MTNLRAAFRRLPASWRKIALAAGGLLTCEIGARVVAPSINGGVLADYLRQVGGSPLLKLADWFVGGALSRGAVLALGIMPYISARVIMRLARSSVPAIAEMSETSAGRRRLDRWTRGLTFGLAAVQSFGFARFVQAVPGAVTHPGTGFIAQTMIVLTTGAMGVAWLAERMARQQDVDDPAADAIEEIAPGSAQLHAGQARPALPPPDVLDRVPTANPKPDRVRLGL